MPCSHKLVLQFCGTAASDVTFPFFLVHIDAFGAHAVLYIFNVRQWRSKHIANVFLPRLVLASIHSVSFIPTAVHSAAYPPVHEKYTKYDGF